MNILTFLNGLRPAIPMSSERPCTITSNSELRRWIDNGSVLINGEKTRAMNDTPFEVNSIVFFPKSNRKTTIW